MRKTKDVAARKLKQRVAVGIGVPAALWLLSMFFGRKAPESARKDIGIPEMLGGLQQFDEPVSPQITVPGTGSSSTPAPKPQAAPVKLGLPDSVPASNDKLQIILTRGTAPEIKLAKSLPSNTVALGELKPRTADLVAIKQYLKGYLKDLESTAARGGVRNAAFTIGLAEKTTTAPIYSRPEIVLADETDAALLAKPVADWIAQARSRGIYLDTTETKAFLDQVRAEQVTA